ncbi:MAG TPA: hypothetical protein VMS78_15860 [Rhizomicrobium sp.]|nr:hypothetical protein [Rhizomicrobium sp.]
MSVIAQKIPLALGFANLSGADLEQLITEDFETLSPLFEKVARLNPGQVPVVNVLFAYGHLDSNGVFVGTKGAGIRQLAQAAKAAIVVLASENPDANIIKAGGVPGPKKANLVFTNNRNGSGFGRFFRSLFEIMRDGTGMASAWVQLAPQGPQRHETWIPGTIFAAEAGNLVFPVAKKEPPPSTNARPPFGRR